jgi:hypothetical protein
MADTVLPRGESRARLARSPRLTDASVHVAFRRRRAQGTPNNDSPDETDSSSIPLDATGRYPAKYSCERIWTGREENSVERLPDEPAIGRTFVLDFPYEFVANRETSSDTVASVLLRDVPALQWGILWMASEVVGLHSCDVQDQNIEGWIDRAHRLRHTRRRLELLNGPHIVSLENAQSHRFDTSVGKVDMLFQSDG